VTIDAEVLGLLEKYVRKMGEKMRRKVHADPFFRRREQK
jgi:hypothetical protein